MKPQYGIIGCGNIASFHLNGLEKVGANILYVADLDAQAAASYAEKTGAIATTDYRDLLNDPNVNVISVLTHSRTHKEICTDALLAGKAVICEKTMTENAADSAELVQLIQKAKIPFYMGYMKRFFPAVRKAKELIPALGTLFSSQIRSYQPWGNLYDANDLGNFSSVFHKYGGAIIKCAGSHMLDLMLFLLGRPQRVYAQIDYLSGSSFDRRATALFEFDSSLTASFEAAGHPLKRIGYERNAWDECFQINGVNGRLDLYTVMWDHPEYNGAMLVYYDNETETLTEFRFPAVNPFDLEVACFHNSLIQGIPASPNGVDGFCVDLLIESMEKAHQQKAAMTIDYKGL